MQQGNGPAVWGEGPNQLLLATHASGDTSLFPLTVTGPSSSLLQGLPVVFRVGLALLHCSCSDLLQMDIEAMLKVL